MPQRPAGGQPRHILLCVAGLPPQIITETLYALTQQRGERIDEIRVITTLGGRDRILQMLLNKDDGKFFALCRDYSIDPGSILFNETTISLLHGPDGRMLSDIRSIEDNACAANQICEIVRELKRDPYTRLHASAAGGRKTMSIYLTAAMQLFGRAEDRLSHVLVSEDFETHPDFFYIPPMPQELEVKRAGQVIKRLSTADAAIHLADIPFIRLRGSRSAWWSASGRSYNDFVQQAQGDLNLLDSVHELRIDARQKTIVVANRAITLTPRELFIYALMAYMREQGRGDNGFVRLDEITTADLDTVFRRITAAKGCEWGLEDYEFVPEFKFLPKLVRQLAEPADYKDVTQTFRETISRIKRQCDKQRLPERYLITTSGAPGALRYGMRMRPSERIIWDNEAPPSATP
jgi:CRISPR-associated protein (TIGR02584 family)